MSWLAEALVRVAVVHGDEVDVAEYEAFVVVLLQRLGVANVEQFGPVKRLFSFLRDENGGKKRCTIQVHKNTVCIQCGPNGSSVIHTRLLTMVKIHASQW